MRQILIDVPHQQLDDLKQIAVAQGVKDDDLIEPVQEFGIEQAFNFGEHQVLDFLVGRRIARRLEAELTAFLQITRANV